LATKSLFFDIFARDHNTGQTFKGIGASARGLTKVFSALAVGVAAAFEVKKVYEFGKATVEAFAEADKSQAKLEDAFARFPDLVSTNVAALRKLNEEIQSKTGVDHNQLAAAQANLAAFGLTGEQLKKITPLVADYALKTGQDAPTAATAIGRALLGNTRALKTIGINFKATGNEAKDFTTIFGLMQGKIGGFAESQGKTFAGQLEILKATFQDLKEKVGAVFAPALGDLVALLNDHVLPAFSSLTDTIGPKVKKFLDAGARGLGDFIDALANSGKAGSLKPLSDFFDKAAQNIPPFAILKDLSDVLGPVMPQIAQAFSAIGDALMQPGVMDAITNLITDVLPPLVALLVALTPLIPPLADAITNGLVPALESLSGQITGWESVFSGNLDAMKAWLRGVMKLGGPLGGFIHSIIDNEVKLLNFFIDAINTASAGITGFINAFSGLTHLKVSLPQLGHVSLSQLLDTTGTVGGGGSGKSNVRLAEGAVVTARPGGVRATIGEGRHDEAVIPLTDSVLSRIGGRGGDTIHVSVTGFVGSEDFLAKTLQRVIVNGRKRGTIQASFA
jgi:hypothetical protein